MRLSATRLAASRSLDDVLKFSYVLKFSFPRLQAKATMEA